jgi:hypothetical protein
MEAITVKKTRPWAAVPNDLLEDRRLSLRARLVLAWMVGRPDGWEIKVWHMCRTLGASAHVWTSIRKELEAAGYYQQDRRRSEDGRIQWVKTVRDMPDSAPSPKASMMGEVVGGVAGSDSSGDIPIPASFKELPPPKSPKAASPVIGDEELVSHLEAAWWMARGQGRAPVRDEAAWRASIRKRLLKHGPSAEDLACLTAYQHFCQSQVQASPPGLRLEEPPPLPRSEGRQRLKQLRQILQPRYSTSE